MKNFIFATVSGLALTFSQYSYAEEATTAPEAEVIEIVEVQPEAPKATAHKPVAKHHHHKHHAHGHAHHGHAHHHKHAHHMHPHTDGYRVRVDGVYVAFPPFDECGRQVCAPQYYWGNPECPFAYHGGYFWYPHSQGNMLTGYVPYNYRGMYWYPSRMHPHMIYVDKVAPVYHHPYQLHLMPHPMDNKMGMNAPMEKKFEGAPIEMPAKPE